MIPLGWNRLYSGNLYEVKLYYIHSRCQKGCQVRNIHKYINIGHVIKKTLLNFIILYHYSNNINFELLRFQLELLHTVLITWLVFMYLYIFAHDNLFGNYIYIYIYIYIVLPEKGCHYSMFHPRGIIRCHLYYLLYLYGIEHSFGIKFPLYMWSQKL